MGWDGRRGFVRWQAGCVRGMGGVAEEGDVVRLLLLVVLDWTGLDAGCYGGMQEGGRTETRDVEVVEVVEVAEEVAEVVEVVESTRGKRDRR